MLGRYDNFPQNIHRIDAFTFSLPIRRIQEKIVQALRDINKTAVSAVIDNEALRDCTLTFEAGVAELRSFSFVDELEASKLLGAIKKEPLEIIDIFLAACYYKTRGDKRNPLRFDYFLVRTVFKEKSLEFRVFHERGPRYISPEDIGNLLAERINKLALRKILKNS
jgi:hypothetical protein